MSIFFSGPLVRYYATFLRSERSWKKSGGFACRRERAPALGACASDGRIRDRIHDPIFGPRILGSEEDPGSGFFVKKRIRIRGSGSEKVYCMIRIRGSGIRQNKFSDPAPWSASDDLSDPIFTSNFWDPTDPRSEYLGNSIIYSIRENFSGSKIGSG